MLSVTDAVAWLPATSTAVPVTTWPAPSVLTVMGSGHRAMPLPPSVHVKLTLTSLLFQPAAFADGLTTALIVGRLLSMLSVTDTVAWLPALSTAVPLTTCPAPSVLTVTGSGHRAIPLTASLLVKLTRNSTVKRFDLESDTDRSTVAMFWLRSDVPTTFTPFTSTMALDTRQNWPAGKPPLSTRRV